MSDDPRSRGPIIGDRLYKFVDLLDDTNALCVVEYRVVKIQKHYTFLRTQRGMQTKVRNIDLLHQYSLTASEAVLYEVERFRLKAKAMRGVADRLEADADRYLTWMKGKGL